MSKPTMRYVIQRTANGLTEQYAGCGCWDTDGPDYGLKYPSESEAKVAIRDMKTSDRVYQREEFDYSIVLVDCPHLEGL